MYDIPVIDSCGCQKLCQTRLCGLVIHNWPLIFMEVVVTGMEGSGGLS